MKLPGLANLLMVLVITGIILFLIFLLFNSFNKTEGFYPVDGARIQYELIGKQRYNQFADMQDPFNIFGTIPLDGSGQPILDGALKTPSYESSGQRIKKGSAMEIRDDDPTIYTPLPIDKELMRRIKLCEAVSDWKCEAFQDDDFNKYCGICIKDCETSGGIKRNFSGLYIDPYMRKNIVDDAKIEQKEPEIIPTVGKVKSAKDFILYRPDCDYRKDRYQCANAKSISDPNVIEKCVACFTPPTGKPTFVYTGKRGDKASLYKQQQKPYYFDAVFRLVTSQNASRIELKRRSTGKPVEMIVKSPQEFEFILTKTYESEQFTLSVEYQSFTPYQFTSDERNAINTIVGQNTFATSTNIQKTDDASQTVCTEDSDRVYKMATDDKLFYGCGDSRCCKRIPPSISRKFGIIGQFESSANSRRTFPFDQAVTSINGLEIKADDGPPRYGTLKNSPIFSKILQAGSVPRMPSNRFWIWDSDEKLVKCDFMFIVPVSFLEVTFPELDGSLCPTGAMVSLEDSYDRLRAGPCMKLINGLEQVPGTYTDECVKSLFMDGGCLEKGRAFPRSRSLTEAITLDSAGRPMATEDIVDTVSRIKANADKPYTLDTDIKLYEKANLDCYGTFEFNPCKGPLEKSGPQSPVCLDFLFKNAGKITKGIGPTYNQSSNRTSGSGVNEKKPILYCQRNGTAAPIGSNGKINIDAVNKANSYGSIENIRNYYDNIHRTANYSLMADEQYKAMRECYGVTMNKGQSCGTPLDDPSKIADGSKFTIIPSVSPGSKVMNLMSAVIGQANVSPSSLSQTQFSAKEDEEGNIQIVTLSGPPANGKMLIDGFKLKFAVDDGTDIFKLNSTWKVVDSIAGNPGEVSFQSKSKPNFYLQFNMLDRTLVINNSQENKGSMSFSIKYIS